MAKSSRRLAVLPDEDDPRVGPSQHGGKALAVAVAVGLIVGVVAVFFAYRAFKDGAGGDSAAAPVSVAAATDAAEPLRIVFPEGFTRDQMAVRVTEVNRIAQEKREVETSLLPSAYHRAASDTSLIPTGFLKRKDKPKTLEGFLFPATYEFTPTTTSRELVDQQLDAFVENWSRIDLKDVRKEKLTPYQVLIVASIIEEEVRVPKERELVAAVIYNRLARGMPLGVDATLRYGLEIPPTEAIRQSQLDSANPYNTRARAGLPPTPITNPGLASMQAAAHPAARPFLYFARRKDCKSHFFTASEAEFQEFLAGPNSFLNGPSECP